MKNEPTVSQQDRRRKAALIVFQIVLYGYLFAVFVIQMCMYSARDW